MKTPNAINPYTLEAVNIHRDADTGGTVVTLVELTNNFNRIFMHHSSPMCMEDVFYHLLEGGLLSGMFVWDRNLSYDIGYYCSHYRGDVTAFWPLPDDSLMGQVLGDRLVGAPWFIVEQWHLPKLPRQEDLEFRDPIAPETPL